MADRTRQRWFLFVAAWTAGVILLGAWVRITDAGLGCPDWPGCYGRILPPLDEAALLRAAETHPGTVPEAGRALREMIHRYAASGLGALILLLAWRLRHERRDWPLAGGLVALVVFQGLLGMWTVTLMLRPLVVVLHLIGGLTLLGLLVAGARQQPPARADGRAFGRLALAVLGIQIFLGGWVSAQYAGLACPDFPTCGGQWVPATTLSPAFPLWPVEHRDFSGGLLDADARATVHWLHRIGAAAVLGTLLAWAAWLWRGAAALRPWVLLLAGALAAQVLLGVGNVLLRLPVALALAHSAGAAALVALAVWLHRHPAAPAGRTGA